MARNARKIGVGSDRGQTLALFAVSLAVLFGLMGLVIDVGHAYFLRRTLQSQVDAAALAGAQKLPDGVAAASIARQFSGAAGQKNESAAVPGVAATIATRCAAPTGSCATPSAVAVSETTHVGTMFAKVLGINSFDIGARATACAASFGASYLIDETGASCLAAPAQCVIGYPYSSSNPRTSQTFSESAVLRDFTTGTNSSGHTINVWYNDEHALTLGVRQVVVKTSSGSTTTNYTVSPLATNPGSTPNPAVGSTITSGDQAGTDTSARPAFPALYVTDITTNPASTSGDWQNFGTAVPPQAVFGTWKAAVTTVDKTRSPAVFTVTPDA
ncbi:MAG: putative Flp pilus-assembly TadE/G-like, partial [Pseudonocardiales bacterium]|nr:putative Flp pilus-assembly TadE/G-like [Pseudonocardiales bacterium]